MRSIFQEDATHMSFIFQKYNRDSVMKDETIVSENCNFITQSRYEGSFNSALHIMDGIGTYFYPDGSEYRGCFKMGKFHGYGRLRLATPYKFTVKGMFRSGSLVQIEDMWFSDNVHVRGNFDYDKFNCSEWEYITPQDRRYAAESRYGQQPVGPTSYLTNKLVSRRVPIGCYDTEEGIFSPRTGWLMDRPPPFQKSEFIGCEKIKRWVIENCRYWKTKQFIEPPGSVCRSIIRTNLEAELDLLRCSDEMQPTHQGDRKRYFHKLCEERKSAKRHRERLELKDKTKVKPSPPKKGLCNENPPTDVELCMKELAGFEADDEAELSTTDDYDPVCIGPIINSTTSHDTFTEPSIVEDVADICENVESFRKSTQMNGNVVQSNLLLKTSHADLQRDVFEL